MDQEEQQVPDFGQMDQDQIAAQLTQMWQQLQQANVTIQGLGQLNAQLQHQLQSIQLPAPIVNVPQPIIQMPQITQPAAGGFKPAKPEVFKGERGSTARSFIQACELYFTLRPNDFTTEAIQIQFTLMLLQDKAARWAQPIMQEVLSPPATGATHRTTVWATFKAEFVTAFYDPDEARSAAHRMRELKQKRSAAEYTSEFRELVAILGWTEEAQLRHQYYQGLKDHVKDDLATRDDPATLDALIRLAIQIDNRHYTRSLEKKENAGHTTHRPTPRPQPRVEPTPPPPPASQQYIPMDLSATNSRRITPQERKRRFDNNLCLYCGQSGHRKSACPSLKAAGGVARAQLAATEEGTADNSDTTQQSGNSQGL